MFQTKPFVFRFNDQPLREKKLSSHEFPKWGHFHLTYAEKYLVEFKHASILLQSFNCEYFHVDVFQLNTTAPFTLVYETGKNQLFLFFMLKGAIVFSTHDGIPINNPKESVFYLAYNDAGLYNAVFQTGTHIALSISLSPKWMGTLDTSECPALESAMTRFLDKQVSYGIMPSCQLSNQTNKWLKELYTMHHRIHWVQTFEMKAIVSRMLIHYEDLVQGKYQQIAYKAKAYIEGNFSDSTLSVSKIAVHLCTTEKTLIKQFKSAFGISPFQYLKSYRMLQAQKLLASKKATSSEVHLMVGCNDRDNFSKQFKKTFGYSPSQSVKNEPCSA